MTNETKHTPGPWRVNGGLVIDSRDNIVAIRRSRDHLTKDPGYDRGEYIQPVEADANVVLIAAAPALLEALETLVAYVENRKGHAKPYAPAMHRAHTTIAEARNEKAQP